MESTGGRYACIHRIRDTGSFCATTCVAGLPSTPSNGADLLVYKRLSACLCAQIGALWRVAGRPSESLRFAKIAEDTVDRTEWQRMSERFFLVKLPLNVTIKG